MILYINGDSHSAAAEAVVPYNSIGEDLTYKHAAGSKAAHPKNIEACYGQHLANSLGAALYLDAVSGSSNQRIIRTTLEFVESNLYEDIFIVIGWSTVEREEIYHNGKYHCLSAGSFIDHELKYIFKQWILNNNHTDYEKAINSHNQICKLHKYLNDRNIQHLFFNTTSIGWDLISRNDRIEWNSDYLHPYDPNFDFSKALLSIGCKHAIWQNRLGNGNHFNAEAHLRWAEFLLPYIKEKRHKSAV